MAVRKRKAMHRVYNTLFAFFTREYFEGDTFTLQNVQNRLVAEYNQKYPVNHINDGTGLYDGIRTLTGRVFEKTQSEKKYRIVRNFEERDRRWFHTHYYQFAAKGKRYMQWKAKNSKNTKKQPVVERKEGADTINHLQTLGSQKTKYNYDKPDMLLLETFPNQFPEKKYITKFTFPEFTSLCPKTGQPDFGEICIQYIPKQSCIETKSLKLYLLTYRQHGSFMETIVNQILNDLVKVCDPYQMEITGTFNPRGGTYITVTVAYEAN